MFPCHDLPIRCHRIQVGPVLVDAAGAVECGGGEVAGFRWTHCSWDRRLFPGSFYFWVSISPSTLGTRCVSVPPSVNWTRESHSLGASVLVLCQPIFMKQVLSQKVLSHREGAGGDNSHSWFRRIS